MVHEHMRGGFMEMIELLFLHSHSKWNQIEVKECSFPLSTPFILDDF